METLEIERIRGLDGVGELTPRVLADSAVMTEVYPNTSKEESHETRELAHLAGLAITVAGLGWALYSLRKHYRQI